MQKGKMPKAASINRMDTDPREFVFDLMAKTMGWKYVEQYGDIRFQHRRDYVESFQGGHVLQEHCGECGAMDHIDEKKMFSGKGEFEVKYASSKRGPIKVSKFNTLDDAKKFLAQVKGEGMNGIISKGGKPVKEEVEEAFKIGDKVKISKTASKGTKSGHKDVLSKSGKIIKDYGDGDMKVNFGGNDDRSVSAKDLVKEALDDEDETVVKKVVKMLKKASKAHAGQADDLEKSMKEHHQKDANGEPIPHDDEEDLSEARKETPAEFLKRGGKIKKVKAGMGKEGKKRVADFKKSFKKTKAKEDELDAKEREEREKNNEETVHEAWIDTDARKVQSKWKKMDKKAKKKWMDGVMAKAKKEGMPKDELMDVLDDYGLVEGTMTGKDSDSIEGPAKGMKHKCPTHVKKEGFGYGKNISHTVSENIVDKMNIYWFDSQEVSVMMPTSEVEIVSEGYHSMKNHREKFKSTNRIAEGYMVLPAMDRNKYTPMRGMEGPFPTFSGKVLYYDPKAGMYYDRDSDMYLSYDAYLEYDKMTSAQQKQMAMGPLGDPKSKEYKAMERLKNKVAKKAKKNQLKNESIGMNFIRKHYQKNDE